MWWQIMFYSPLLLCICTELRGVVWCGNFFWMCFVKSLLGNRIFLKQDLQLLETFGGSRGWIIAELLVPHKASLSLQATAFESDGIRKNVVRVGVLFLFLYVSFADFDTCCDHILHVFVHLFQYSIGHTFALSNGYAYPAAHRYTSNESLECLHLTQWG